MAYTAFSAVYKFAIPLFEQSLIILPLVFGFQLRSVHASPLLDPLLLQVSMDINGKNSWKQCFSVEGVRLPTGFYFGASAATGDLAGITKGLIN